MKGLFPVVRGEVAKIIDPAKIRWIGFSHFESDECGALNDWLEIALEAAPVCSFVGAMVSVNDFSKNLLLCSKLQFLQDNFQVE